VLVAAFEVSHPRHTVCLPWLQQAQTEQIHGLIATHTLAELYSVLTRLPVRPRISPELAQRLITENLERFEVIPLTTEDYQMVLAQMVNLNLTGGGIYDGLIAQAAVKAEVNTLLTLNPNHFTRLGEDIARLVQVPQ
jgi:predicted nucleic acid-binding protein